MICTMYQFYASASQIHINFHISLFSFNVHCSFHRVYREPHNLNGCFCELAQTTSEYNKEKNRKKTRAKKNKRKAKKINKTKSLRPLINLCVYQLIVVCVHNIKNAQRNESANGRIQKEIFLAFIRMKTVQWHSDIYSI